MKRVLFKHDLNAQWAIPTGGPGQAGYVWWPSNTMSRKFPSHELRILFLKNIAPWQIEIHK
jgi:hypothetical protein